MAAVATAWGAESELAGLRGAPRGALERDERALVEHSPTMGEAALWLLAIAVGRGACEGGVVHVMVPGEPRLVTRAAHAPHAERVLGASVSTSDAAVVGAACDGANDALTEWARSMTTLRLAAGGLAASGVLALPLRARGLPIGLLEVSAPQRRIAFTPTNVALLRALAAAFEARPARI